ncbi:MAG: BatA domain-containing protein [Acidobacteriota bacterium]|nr:BatA domain-containing protein [Acidobacteriota bacterium]
MGFLAPWFLGGLAILGLPVYVHLLRQYRQKPVPFSSLMFFERRTQSSIKHRRLKYLLLFSLRCLFVLLLALAFARPYIHSATIARANGGRTMVFALDNSFSMRQDDRFAHAKKAALDAIHAMRPEDRGQVISFGGPSKLLTDMTQDHQALRAALAAIQPGDDTSSYAELSRVLRSISESLKSDIAAFVFTDAQKSSLPPAFSDLKLDDGTKMEIHSVATAPVPNWTVENVEAPGRVFDTKKVRTVATIAGYGTPEGTRKATLFANGRPLETKQVQVPANGRATVEFLALDAPYGLTRCEVRLDAADAFPQDDHWFFSVERADPKPALLVHAPEDTASSLYVKTALESSSEAAFKLESLSSSQSADANVSKYAFVILSDPGPLPRKFEDALDKYVQAGGSVLLTLGKNAVPGLRLPVADLQVTALHSINPERESVLTVASVDTSYPAFSKAQNWGGVEFFQSAKLQLPQASPDTRIAATLSDGSPLFIDRKIGAGHALVLTSALDNIAGNLPVEPVWLPFIDQTTHDMGGIGAAQGNYKVGAFVELRTAREKGVPVEIVGPGGEGTKDNGTKDTRLLSLSESTKASSFRFPSQGFFDIRRANGREELAAVNTDRRESDFALVPQETLTLWKNTGAGGKSVQSAASAEQRDDKAELWPWVLAMLAVLAVAESVLANKALAPVE